MRGLPFMLALLHAGLAVADDGSPRDTMHHYFEGEMNERWAFGGLGLASVGAGVGLASAGRPATVGAAVPLLAVGVIQLALGIGLWVRTPGQVAALDAQLDGDLKAFITAERLRMARVNRGFVLYKIFETSLFFAGAGLAGVGGITSTDSLFGAGLALAGEALVMLVLDLFAETRGQGYERALGIFTF